MPKLSKLLSYAFYIINFCSLLFLFVGLYLLVYLFKPLNFNASEDYINSNTSNISTISRNTSAIFEIKKGDSLHEISNKLAEKNIINHPKLMRGLIYLAGQDGNVQAGEYEFNSDINLYSLIRKIITGDVKHYAFPIIEGSNLIDIIKKLKNLPALNMPAAVSSMLLKEQLTADDIILLQKIIIKNLQDSYLSLDKSDKLDKLEKNNTLATPLVVDLSSLKSVEGLFYPDTYYYVKNDSLFKVLGQAFNRLNKELNTAWQERLKSMPKDTTLVSVVTSPYQGLILASILEKEAADMMERKLVSGVIYNRLRLNMPLQVDPTVIYSLGVEYNGNLTKKDMANNSEYNTYRNKGLPPAPISAVSIESIRAAFNPAKHDLLYFVAMGNGKHYFSSTLEQHNDAVRKYQKNKVKLEESQSVPEPEPGPDLKTKTKTKPVSSKASDK